MSLIPPTQVSRFSSGYANRCLPAASKQRARKRERSRGKLHANSPPDQTYAQRIGSRLIYHVRDPGKGFSFDALRHAAISNPPDARAAHLQRNLVDELIYNERGNEVHLIKYL